MSEGACRGARPFLIFGRGAPAHRSRKKPSSAELLESCTSRRPAGTKPRAAYIAWAAVKRVSKATGLVFIGATNDRRFRAFDAKTGKVIWETQLEAGAYATPITYQGRDGKQYVVIGANGGSFFGSAPSDEIIAYALP